MDTSPFSIDILHFMEPLISCKPRILFQVLTPSFLLPWWWTKTKTHLGTAGESIYFLVCFTRIHFAGASIRSGTPVKGAMTSSTWQHGKSSFSSRNIFLLARGESKTENFHIMIPFSFLQKSKKLAFTLNFIVVFHYI